MSTLSLMQGTVGLLILRSLQKGPAHGYAITRWVHERTDGVLAVEDCIALKPKAGSRPSGAYRRTTAERSTTA
jgi:DNA-binding PadR family transcriptional regulator